MKNEELYQLRAVIEEVKELGNNSFKLALALNAIKIDDRIKALDELKKPTEAYSKFDEERIQLSLKHAEEKEGAPVIYSQPEGKGVTLEAGSRGFFNINKDKKEYEESLVNLRKEHEQTIKAHEDKMKAFNETLQKDVAPVIEFVSVEILNVPEIGFEQLRIMLPLIKN